MLFNEPKLLKCPHRSDRRSGVLRFSALQRAEIAEIAPQQRPRCVTVEVSVLFNEPKLLKLSGRTYPPARYRCFSALQRAEIAEIQGFCLV